jgi:hypothetical protein
MIAAYCREKGYLLELGQPKQAQTRMSDIARHMSHCLLSHVSEHASTQNGLEDTRTRTQGCWPWPPPRAQLWMILALIQSSGRDVDPPYVHLWFWNRTIPLRRLYIIPYAYILSFTLCIHFILNCMHRFYTYPVHKLYLQYIFISITPMHWIYFYSLHRLYILQALGLGLGCCQPNNAKNMQIYAVCLLP